MSRERGLAECSSLGGDLGTGMCNSADVVSRERGLAECSSLGGDLGTGMSNSADVVSRERGLAECSSLGGDLGTGMSNSALCCGFRCTVDTSSSLKCLSDASSA